MPQFLVRDCSGILWTDRKEKRNMEKIKKNPPLAGILNCVGTLIALLLIDLVFSLINKRPFAEQVSEPVSLIILIIGPIVSGISSYMKAKKELSEKKE